MSGKMAPLGKGTNTLRWFLCIMSILFTIIGLCMIVAGGLTVADVTHGQVVDPSVRVGRAMIIFGVGIMVISVAGCIGAFRRKSKLLYIYLGLLLFFLLAQIALVVYANVDTDFPRHIWLSLSVSSRTTLQQKADCCGWEANYRGGKTMCPTDVPSSCYAPRGNANDPNCWDSLVRNRPEVSGFEYGIQFRGLGPEIGPEFYILYQLVDADDKPITATVDPLDVYIAVSSGGCKEGYSTKPTVDTIFDVPEPCYGAPGTRSSKVCLSNSLVPPYTCDAGCVEEASVTIPVNRTTARFHNSLGTAANSLYNYGIVGPMETPPNNLGILGFIIKGSGVFSDGAYLRSMVVQPEKGFVPQLLENPPRCGPNPAAPGCAEALRASLKKYRAILIGVGVTGLLVQLVTLFATVMVIRGVKSAERAGSAHHQYLSSHQYEDSGPAHDVDELKTVEPMY